MIGDEPHTDAGTYVVTKESAAGCTIIDRYHLTVHPIQQITLPDTVLCFGDKLCLDGDCYEKTTDGVFVRTLNNRYNCDSTVVINVSYADEMKPTIDLTQMSETILEASVRFGGSGYTYYTINGGAPQTDTELTGLDAGIYEVTFYNEIGCDTTQTFDVIAPCLRNLIFQRWNDVLSIKNEASQDPRLNHGRNVSLINECITTGILNGDINLGNTKISHAYVGDNHNNNHKYENNEKPYCSLIHFLSTNL